MFRSILMLFFAALLAYSSISSAKDITYHHCQPSKGPQVAFKEGPNCGVPRLNTVIYTCSAEGTQFGVLLVGCRYSDYREGYKDVCAAVPLCHKFSGYEAVFGVSYGDVMNKSTHMTNAVLLTGGGNERHNITFSRD